MIKFQPQPVENAECFYMQISNTQASLWLMIVWIAFFTGTIGPESLLSIDAFYSVAVSDDLG